MLHHAFAALRSISVNGAQRCSIMQHPRRPHGIELPQLARLQQRAPRLCDALLVMPPCVVGRFEASRHLLAVSGSLASMTRVAGCDVLVAAAAQLLLGSPIERLTIDWRRCSTAVVEKFWRGLRAHQRGFDTLRELTVLRSCRHAPSRRAEDVTALATFGGRVTMRASELETITIDASFLCILTPTHAQKFKDSLTAWVTQTSSRTKMCAIRFTGTPSRPQCRLVPFRNDAELDDNSTSLSPVPHPARRVIFLPPLAGCRRLVVTVRELRDAGRRIVGGGGGGGAATAAAKCYLSALTSVEELHLISNTSLILALHTQRELTMSAEGAEKEEEEDEEEEEEEEEEEDEEDEEDSEDDNEAEASDEWDGGSQSASGADDDALVPAGDGVADGNDVAARYFGASSDDSDDDDDSEGSDFEAAAQLSAADVELLALLPNLRVLRARQCALRSLPPSLARLTNLRVLDLSENMLRTFPAPLCALTQLTELRLGGNALSRLPARFGDFRALTEFSVGDNFALSALPASIVALTELRYLNVEGTAIDLNSASSSVPMKKWWREVNGRMDSDESQSALDLLSARAHEEASATPREEEEG